VNPLNNRRWLPPFVEVQMKEQISRRALLGRSLKTGLALAIPTILTRKTKADTITYNTGKLEIGNEVNDYDFDRVSHSTAHSPGGTEDYGSWDRPYIGPRIWITQKATKIVSKDRVYTSNYELTNDARPLESFTPVNLELSLHEKDGNPISVSNLRNELKFKLPYANPPDFADFSPKPITLWRRFLAEPDKLQFLADIREACAKQGGTGIVPLPNLDGEYASQVPYDFLQVRFDVYPGDFDLHSKVDLNDFSHLARDWGRQGEPREFIGDITGPLGLPDGKVDGFDLERYVRDYLKDIRDIMP